MHPGGQGDDGVRRRLRSDHFVRDKRLNTYNIAFGKLRNDIYRSGGGWLTWDKRRDLVEGLILVSAVTTSLPLAQWRRYPGSPSRWSESPDPDRPGGRGW